MAFELGTMRSMVGVALEPRHVLITYIVPIATEECP